VRHIQEHLPRTTSTLTYPKREAHLQEVDVPSDPKQAERAHLLDEVAFGLRLDGNLGPSRGQEWRKEGA